MLGVLDRAATLWEEAYELRRRELPREHLDMATSLQSLAVLRFSQYKFAEGAELAEEALAIRRKLLDADDPLVDESRLSLATILGIVAPHGYLKDSPRAVALCRESVEWHRKYFGPKHPQTALAMLGLAGTLLNCYPDSPDPEQEATKLILTANPILLKDPATKIMGQTSRDSKTLSLNQDSATAKQLLPR